MLTTSAPSFTDWKDALVNIGLKDSHVTDDLVSVLAAHNFTPSLMMDDSFQGYFIGSTEHEAGEVVARQFASLNSLQEFLEPIIDWAKAWDSVKTVERYILVKTNELNTWGLFMLE